MSLTIRPHDVKGMPSRGVPPPAAAIAPAVVDSKADSPAVNALRTAERMLTSKRAKINWHQFALMNNDVKSSKYDGGNTGEECLKSYLALIAELKDQPPFFGMQDPEVFHDLEKMLKTVLKADECRVNANHVTDVFNHVRGQFAADHPAYLMLGYARAKERNKFFAATENGVIEVERCGHGVGCKIEKDPHKKTVTITMLNLGEGVGYHPELGFTATQMTPSYAFYPITISEKAWEEHGKTFLGYALNLERVDIDDDEAGNSIQQLYDFLALMGQLDPSQIVANAGNLAAKIQHASDCSEKMTRNKIYDYLRTKKNLEKTEIQKVFLNLHLTSLISAYQAYLAAPSRENKKLLRNACREFGTHLLRSEKFIKQQERLDAGALIALIKTKLKTQRKKTPRDPINTPHRTTFNVEEVPKVFNYQLAKNPDKINERFALLPTFNSKTFKNHLRAWVGSLQKEGIDKAKSIYLSLSALPLDGWEGIPPNDCQQILNDLKEIYFHFDQSLYLSQKFLSQNQITLLRYTFYAIYDKVTRAYFKELRDFASPAILDAMADVMVFARGEDAERFLALKEYFKKQDSSRTFLPIAGKISPSMLDRGPVFLDFELFLRQFDQTMQVKDFASLFVDKVPQEIQTLYFLAIEVHNSVHVKQNKTEIPGVKIVHYDKRIDFKILEDGTLVTHASPKDSLLSLGNQGFNPSHLLRFSEATTNDVVLHKDLGENHYDSKTKAMREELFQIAHKPQLRVPLAIQWMHQHLGDLNNLLVQQMLWTCFFTPGVLEERMSHHAATVDQFREVIAEGLKRANNNLANANASVFLMQCSILLEERVAHISKKPLRQDLLVPYRKTLRSLLTQIKPNEHEREETNLFFTSLFLESVLDLPQEQAFIESFIHRFDYAMNYEKTHQHQFLHDFNFVFQLTQKLQKFVGSNQKAALNRICNGICSYFLKSEKFHNLQFEWVATGVARSKELTLDFINGVMTREGFPLVKMTKTELANDPLPQRYRWHARVVESKDREFPGNSSEAFILPDETSASWTRPGKRVIITSKHQTGNFAFDDVSVDLKTRKKFPFINDFQLTCESQTADQVVIQAKRQGEAKPYCKLTVKDKKAMVTRTDENGKVLMAVNLESLPEEHVDHKYTLDLAEAKDQLCFVGVEGNIEELHFRKIGLTFKRINQQLVCAQHPGYVWTPMVLPALGDLSKKVFVLQNKEGKIKIVTPFPRDEKFKLGAGQESQLASGLMWGAVNSFTFDLEKARDPIVARNLSEKLFWIYFFKVNGKLEQALQRLIELHPPYKIDATALECLCLFFQTKNLSASSLAFNMKLSAFIAERFSEEKNPEIKKCLEALIQKTLHWHVDYLRALGDHKYGGIGKNERLEEIDEGRILAIYRREKIKLPKILRIREELLNTTTRTAHEKYLPQTIDISPFAYEAILAPSKLVSIEYPITVAPSEKALDALKFRNLFTLQEVVHHFTSLYTRAKRCKKGELDEFDFMLLGLLRTIDNESFQGEGIVKNPLKLAQVLFYVRHFPEIFSDLDFDPKETSFVVMAGVFHKICARLGTIESLPEYPKFVTDVLKRKAKFDYVADVIVTLPEKVAPSTLPASGPLGIDSEPFKAAGDCLFKTIHTPYTDPGPLFDTRLLSNPTPEEREILATFETGKKELSELGKVSHQRQKDNSEKTRAILNNQAADYKNKVEEARQRAFDMLNKPYQTFPNNRNWLGEMELNLRLNAGQTCEMTPEMVMERVILRNDAAFLMEERPMLNGAQIQEIVSVVHLYFHLQMVLQMTNEALRLVDKTDPVSENALLEILNYRFDYSPEKYPEIAFFKLRTGKHPRRSQVLIHQWVAEGMDKGESRLYTAKAGDGKSSFNIPLEILRGQRYPMMPVIFTTKEMLNVYRGELGAILIKLGIELQVLDIDMHDPLPVSELARIRGDLKHNVRKRRPLLMTPVGHQTLKLHTEYAQLGPHNTVQEIAALASSFADPKEAFGEAFSEILSMMPIEMPKEQSEEEAHLSKIMEIFRQESWQIMDESHRTLDPTTQAILGVGTLVNLAHRELEILFELTRPLVGLKKVLCDNGKEVAALAIATGVPKQEDRIRIRNALALHIAGTLLEDLPKNEWAPFLRFWTEKNAPAPTSANLSGEDKHAILLVRNFLLKILPKVLKMRTDYDHMAFEEEGEVDAPALHKTLTRAQYEDPYLKAVLCIKGSMQRGLTEKQILKLIESMQECMEYENRTVKNLEKTPTCRKFLEWTGLSLAHVNFFDSNQWKFLVAKLKKHQAATERYLADTILPHICYASEKFTLTPVDLVAEFPFSVVTSATPMTPLAHPRKLKPVKNMLSNNTFETEVITRAVSKKNNTFIHPENPAEFFALLRKTPQMFEHVRAWIDAGGFFCDEFNCDVAKTWLECAPKLDGVYFCKEKDNKLCLLLRKNWAVIEFEHGSEKIADELGLLKIDVTKLELAALFGSAHAESLNLILKPGAQGIVFVCDNLSLKHIVQGFLRLRSFLIDNMNQGVMLAVPPAVKDKIPHFSPQALMSWLVKNEAQRQRGLLVLNAHHEILHQIKSLAKDPTTNKVVLQHGKGFKEKVAPTESWTLDLGLVNTDDALKHYAEATYARFAFDRPLSSRVELQKDLQIIYDEIRQKVPKITAARHQNTTRNMHHKMKMVQKTKLTQKQFQSQGFKNPKPEPMPKLACITDPNFVHQFTRAQLAQTLFDEPNLTEGFYLDPSQFNTASCEGRSLGKEYLKRVDFILIVVQKHREFAVALSNETVARFMPMMIAGAKKELPHQCFLITADGRPAQIANGPLAPTAAQMTRILNSPWLHDVICDAALLDGHLMTLSDRFKARTHPKRWRGFETFALNLLKALPNIVDEDIQSLSLNISFANNYVNKLKLNFK